MLIDELEWADSADSLSGFDSMSETDIRIIANELADFETDDKSKDELLKIIEDRIPFGIVLSDAKKMDTDKLRSKVHVALYHKHSDALKERPLKYLVDEREYWDLDTALDSNLIDIDVEAMARQEVDNAGAAAIIGEGGNQESILNPNTDNYLEIIW